MAHPAVQPTTGRGQERHHDHAHQQHHPPHPSSLPFTWPALYPGSDSLSEAPQLVALGSAMPLPRPGTCTSIPVANDGHHSTATNSGFVSPFTAGSVPRVSCCVHIAGLRHILIILSVGRPEPERAFADA